MQEFRRTIRSGRVVMPVGRISELIHSSFFRPKKASGQDVLDDVRFFHASESVIESAIEVGQLPMVQA